MSSTYAGPAELLINGQSIGTGTVLLHGHVERVATRDGDGDGPTESIDVLQSWQGVIRGVDCWSMRGADATIRLPDGSEGSVVATRVFDGGSELRGSGPAPFTL